jgi:hypothetical protein
MLSFRSNSVPLPLNGILGIDKAGLNRSILIYIREVSGSNLGRGTLIFLTFVLFLSTPRE